MVGNLVESIENVGEGANVEELNLQVIGDRTNEEGSQE